MVIEKSTNRLYFKMLLKPTLENEEHELYEQFSIDRLNHFNFYFVHANKQKTLQIIFYEV